ncbi:thiamine pyrophosphate dependent pyruvate decarboxylase family protein [Actinidia rufa]|uniref:pyruvate decarboxylase n=1 Tax=Actinidia rufa TaxID=165716 RepID=A0A7J0FKV2_9ERIC|nr:thiamine pyrophosphate dependent pyruvate decarboxylase family protein [Actinidia rufa]
MGLHAAVEATPAFLDKAVKPVMVGGPNLRVARASEAFVELADSWVTLLPRCHPQKAWDPNTPNPLHRDLLGSRQHCILRRDYRIRLPYTFAGPFSTTKARWATPSSSRRRRPSSCSPIVCLLMNLKRTKVGVADMSFRCSMVRSVGVTLGYAQAVPDKRMIACIGDGSFPVRCEEELSESIEIATGEQKDCLCFIEEIVHKGRHGQRAT